MTAITPAVNPHTFDVLDAARTDAELGHTLAVMARIGQLQKGRNGGVYVHTGTERSSVTVGVYARNVDEYPVMTVASRGEMTVEIDWLSVVLDGGKDLETIIRKAISLLS